MASSGTAGDLKIAFYGDDFTGATDTLATAARAGLRTLLFLGVPTPAQLARAGDLECVGIAGAARAMTPAEMQTELEPVGALFAQLGAPVAHYKTCSTFDSAPQVGSIGAAINILRKHVDNAFVPIVGGQPNLRRYCSFGNLFASAGDSVYRIDRHPTMSRHPVTPMDEADLRLHLQKQGLAQVALLPYPDYARSSGQLDAQIDTLLAGDASAVLMDVASEEHLAAVGRVIWQRAGQQRLLAAGPSSVVQALAAHWGTGKYTVELAQIAPAQGPVLVLAGSLSPMTALQVGAAYSYEQVVLDPQQLASDATYRLQQAAGIASKLQAGRHVLACTSSAQTPADHSTDGRALAQACGGLLAEVLRLAPIKRLGIAGGDTSSHAIQALGAWGLSYCAQLAPGVALCRMHSDDPTLDGMEVMLKGGQMGGEALFEDLLAGSPL